MIQVNENGKVSARELHRQLESKRSFSNWWINKSQYLIENEDFNYNKFVLVQKEGNRNVKRNVTDYILTSDAAKSLCMMEQTDKGRELRLYLINLDKKVNTGELLNKKQIVFLLKIVTSCFYLETRKDCNRIHFNFHNNKFTWHQYRDNLLGISKESLTNQLKTLNIKYKSKDQAIINIDKFKLIQYAITDLLIGLGKDIVFAKNVAETSYELAKQINNPFQRVGKNSLFSKLDNSQVLSIEYIKKNNTI